MNKRLIILAVSFLLLQKMVIAQSDLPLNSSGKIEIVGVEKMDSIKKDDLFQRTSYWFSHLSDSENKMIVTERDSINGKMAGHFKFLVYSQSGLLKKIQGAITYNVTVEVKDYKYRYMFTDFVYHYYAQSRNYVMLDNGRTKPLEETKAGGWQKSWNQSKRAAYTKIVQQINGIKMGMIVKKPAPAIAAAEPKKLDW